MKILGRNVSVSQLVLLAIVAGGIGGIISGAWPITGAIMTILGVVGAIWDHHNSEIRNREIEDFFEAQALLLANKGIGNLYTEAGKLELNKGRNANAVERFQKALEVNQNDKEALASLGAILSIEASYLHWLGREEKSQFKTMFSAAKSYAESGKRIAPNDYRFYDTLGVIYDIEGNHEKARREFRKSGKLRSDPYWHLLMAASWGMSEDHEQELAEVRQAIKNGAKYWLVDFYYARALYGVGDYDAALPELRKAQQARKWHAQVLRTFQDIYYDIGKFGEAAKYAARCGLVVLASFPASSLRHFAFAVHHIVLHLTCGLSKRVWSISRHIPLLRKIHVRVCSPAQPEQSLGFRMMQRKHFKMAEKLLRKACETVPDFPPILLNLSTCLAVQGNRIEAIKKCDMAIQYSKIEKATNIMRRYKQHLESGVPLNPERMVTFED